MENKLETSVNQIVFDFPSRKKTEEEYCKDHRNLIYEDDYFNPKRIVINGDEMWLRNIWRIEILSIIKYSFCSFNHYKIKMGVWIEEKIYIISQYTYDDLLQKCKNL